MLNKNKPVEVIIDKEKCVNCGICVKSCARACFDEYLIQKDTEILVNKDSSIGCMHCGHCMMSCPEDAITIRGEGISEKDLIEIPEQVADYNSFYNLLLKRRSVRQFKNQEIPKETIDQILDAASTAAIGIPPSEVKVLVINGYSNVEEFTKLILKASEQTLKSFNPFVVNIMRPFIGRTMYKVITEFVIPLLKQWVKGHKDGKHHLLFNAPAVILFYGSELSDKEDVLLAATSAIIATESLGLGSCILGIIPFMFERSKELQNRYGTLKSDKYFLAFVLGYADTHFYKAIKRQFKEVKYF